MPYRPLVILLLGLLFVSRSTAQTSPPRGTEFWVAFMERLVDLSDPTDPMTQLRLEIVAGDRPADVRAEIPGSGWSAVVSLAAGEDGAILVPSALAVATGSERVESRGVRVSSSAPILVSAISHHAGSADATIVLPIEALGGEYVAATFDPFMFSSTLRGLAELVIVAPDNGLTVEITPSAATERGRPADVPFTVSLQSGQTYQLQSEGNLTGTRVRAVGGSPCDRFAVFSGNIMALVGECNSVDHLYEQMLPVAALGRTYAAIPFAGRRGDLLEIVASLDATVVSAGPATTTLDAGERLRLPLDSATLVEASRPVAVVQYARGRDCDSVGTLDGDPMLVQLRPITRSGDLAFVAPGSLSFTGHNVTIVADDTASIRLDGAPVTGFRMLPGSSTHAWARPEISGGAHTLAGSGLANATLYGKGHAASYAVDLSATPSLVPTSADAAIVRHCTCDGVVLEAPEGFASYRWSTGDSTRTIVASASGRYAVTVGNGGECAITSDSVDVIVSAPPTLSLAPAIETVDPGEVIPFTIAVGNRTTTGTCPSSVDRVALRFRATMLAPEAITGGTIVGDTLVGTDRIITIRVRRDTVLLDMVAALGDTLAAVVTLEALGGDTCLQAAGDTLARIDFTGCEVGGRRYFLGGEAAAIKPVRPAPVLGEASVEIRTLESGPTRLELVDPLGRTVRTLLDAAVEPGEHRLHLDASGIPAGAYLLVLTTPSRHVVRRVVIR